MAAEMMEVIWKGTDQLSPVAQRIGREVAKVPAEFQKATNVFKASSQQWQQGFQAIDGSVAATTKGIGRLPTATSAAASGVTSATRQMGQGFQQAAQSANGAGQQIVNHLQNVQQAAQAAAAKVASLGGGQGYFGGGGFLGLAAAGAGLSRVLGPIATVLGTIGSIGGSVIGVFGGMASAAAQAAMAVGGALYESLSRVAGLIAGGALAGGAAVGAGLFAVGQRGVGMNLDVRGAEASLTKLLGSADLAKKAVADLRKEAATSLPTLKEMLPAFSQLSQAFVAQMGPEGMAKVLPTMRAFGDAGALNAGGDTNRIGLAMLGFRQMLGRDFAQQEEIGQIGENLGVGLQPILKGAFGTADTEELKKQGISSMQVADAIVAGFQQRFGGAQEAAAATLPGRASNIQDALDNLAAPVTVGLLDKLTEAAGKLLDTLNGFAESTAGAAILEKIKSIFDGVGDAAIRLAEFLPQVFEWTNALVSSIPWEQWGNVAANAFQMIYQGALNVGEWLKDQWPAIWQTAANVVDVAVLNIGGVVAGLVRVFMKMGEDGASAFTDMWSTAKPIIADMIVGIGRLTAVVAGFGAAAAFAMSVTPGVFLAGQSANFQKMGNTLVKTMQEAPGLADAAAASVRSSSFAPLVQKVGGMGDLGAAFQGGFNDFQQGYQGMGGVRGIVGGLWSGMTAPNANNPFAPAPPNTMKSLEPVLGPNFEARAAAADAAARMGYPVGPNLYGGGYGGSLPALPGQSGVYSVPSVQIPEYAPGGGVNVSVNAPVNANLPPDVAARVLQDPAYAEYIRRLTEEYLYSQSQQANPMPSY
jgi:hypothetical protein